MYSVARNSTLTLHYRLALDDGTEVDSSFGGEPLTFSMGDGTLVAGLEELLLGLVAGARERFLVGPDQAFGGRDPDNVQMIERAQFDPSLSLEPGTVIGFVSPAGDEVPGTVVELHPDRVLIDFNHPLAGRNVVFQVHILEVASGAPLATPVTGRR